MDSGKCPLWHPCQLGIDEYAHIEGCEKGQEEEERQKEKLA